MDINFETNISGKKLELLIELLKQVLDPELNISVYDLGLIYSIYYDENSKTIKVRMTVTSPLCPLASYMINQVGLAIKRVFPEIEDIDFEIVFDPPWTPLRMTEEGRRKFKELFGYDIVEQWLKRQQS